MDERCTGTDGVVRAPSPATPGSCRQPKSVSSASRSPRTTARSTSTQSIPRLAARVRACGAIFCATRMPRQSARVVVGAHALQVAGELLDGVDVADALDLDGDPAVVLVAAHQVDGADVGRPLAAHEPQPLAAELRRCRQRLLQVLLDAVLLERRRLAHVVEHVGDDLLHDDLELVVAPRPCAPGCASRARPRTRRPSAASSSSAACSRRCRRGPSPSRRS